MADYSGSGADHTVTVRRLYQALQEMKNNINSTISNHANNKSNPHGVTKAQVGLGNVDNVSKSSILQSVYPTGAIYMSMNSTSPASLFGGTWEQLKDCFLLAAGDTYKAGSTGGEAYHKLTVEELALHHHEQFVLAEITGGKEHARLDWNRDSTSGGVFPQGIGSPFYDGGTGGNKPHNNMPPYLAVYTWKRIA